ncbi:MAG: NAD(P)-binding protein [Gemmatimonadales bacterium]
MVASLLWQTVLIGGGLLGGAIWLVLSLDPASADGDAGRRGRLSRLVGGQGRRFPRSHPSAGPAVGAAWRLRHLERANVTVFEQHQVAGGNAGSFEFAGQRVDFGSHRLHPACDPAILADIRRFLGDQLLDRPRHGRIRLRGRWVRFPLRPLDLLTRLDPGFALGSLGDALVKPLLLRGGLGHLRRGAAGQPRPDDLRPLLLPVRPEDRSGARGALRNPGKALRRGLASPS